MPPRDALNVELHRFLNEVGSIPAPDAPARELLAYLDRLALAAKRLRPHADAVQRAEEGTPPAPERLPTFAVARITFHLEPARPNESFHVAEAALLGLSQRNIYAVTGIHRRRQVTIREALAASVRIARGKALGDLSEPLPDPAAYAPPPNPLRSR